jgi:hypothetical protein
MVEDEDVAIIKKLLVEFNIFVNRRYGRISKLVFSILLLRFLLKSSAKIILRYLDEIDLDEIDLDEKKKLSLNKTGGNSNNSKVKNLKIKVKKILSFRGGGYLSKIKLLKILEAIRQGVTFVELNVTILSVFPFLTKLIRKSDLEISVYDLYMCTATLKGTPVDICTDGNLGFSYLLLIFDDPTDSISFKQKKEEIYRVIFEKGTLASSNKNGEFFMRVFITCAIIFLLKFRDIGGHGPTIYAFFEALIKALKNKKISKSLVRSLVRRLRKNAIPIPPELEDLLAN